MISKDDIEAFEQMYQNEKAKVDQIKEIVKNGRVRYVYKHDTCKAMMFSSLTIEEYEKNTEIVERLKWFLGL
jgi:predicted transcriptional regulator